MQKGKITDIGSQINARSNAIVINFAYYLLRWHNTIELTQNRNYCCNAKKCISNTNQELSEN